MTKKSERIRDSELREWVYSARSKIHGTGLFARRRIRKGDYIGTYGGPEARRNGTYVLWVYELDDEANAVGRSGRNLLRYLNHARPGNAEFDGFDLYALRNIAADEEITFDYEPSYDP
jgi:SET domain-containing protein